MVETCGFVIHPEIPRFGASPTAWVGEDGMIRSVPEYLYAFSLDALGSIPVEHAVQMLAELACTGPAVERLRELRFELPEAPATLHPPIRTQPGLVTKLKLKSSSSTRISTQCWRSCRSLHPARAAHWLAYSITTPEMRLSYEILGELIGNRRP